MQVLITGIGGFIGGYLADECIKSHDEVIGWCRLGKKEQNKKGLHKSVYLNECDMKDRDQVNHLLSQIKPDIIYHMAAKSNVDLSWQGPRETYETNIIAQLNLLESVRELNINPRILIAGSSEEYGLVSIDENPVAERRELNPVSPYGVSKATQDLMAFQYFRNYKMDILRVRSFNQTGPGRSEEFVTSAFAKQIALMEQNKQSPILSVGNLEPIRDFIDVRDGVEAWRLLAEQGESGEAYNICSGIGISIRDILNMLKSQTDCEFEIKSDPAKARPSDVTVLIGDNSKLKSCTDWKIKVSMQKSMTDLLNYWRNKP